MFHVPVWANLAKGTVREVDAPHPVLPVCRAGDRHREAVRAHRITFFENGIVSLNLPPLAQVVGARATRATHPQVLAGFHRLLSEVVSQNFDVGNPYSWLTKAEAVERICGERLRGLIRDTRSCAHVHEMTKTHPHCGLCSQCIDRRFAVLAAGLKREDPAEAYKVDLFTGERLPGPGRELALAYVRSVSDIDRMTEVDSSLATARRAARSDSSLSLQGRWQRASSNCIGGTQMPCARYLMGRLNPCC